MSRAVRHAFDRGKMELKQVAEKESHFRELSWLGGLFDGEGYFGIRIQKRDTGIGYQMAPQAVVSMISADFVKAEIGTLLDKTGVNYHLYDVKENVPNQQTQKSVQITGIENTWKFARVMENFTKIKHDQIWLYLTEIYPRFKMGKHNQRRGFLQTIAWVDVLNDLKGGNRGRYNLEYFEEKWAMKLQQSNLPKDHPSLAEGGQ